MILIKTCRVALALFALTFVASTASAQPLAERLLERSPGQSAGAPGQSIATVRRAAARVNARALQAERIEISLFEDVQLTARRTSRSRPRSGSTIWQGKVEAAEGGEVTLASVDDVIAGTITLGGRLYEIGVAGSGLHEVREMNPALFPSEEIPLDPFDLTSASGSANTTTTSTTSGSDAAGQIDVMVVWTPAARMAAGGTTAAIQSVVDLAVANANAAYANSQILTSLRLVYSGEVNYSENASSISTDLYRIEGTTDGHLDQLHGLRTQYGADIVTLMGSGYASAGACGIGFLMSSVSTAFASEAFNVVDKSCAGGYLSYAHEVGHNQGLHHDPANAGGAPSYAYAYGYQDPSGAFRTVMSYGAATRVQQFSNPTVQYSGRPTGTASQDNAQALNRNAWTVANFRSASGTPACTYAVTPTVLNFSETGGTAAVAVTTDAGCPWNASTGASWISAGPGGTGPGSIILNVAANTGGQRSATALVAGVTITVTEAGLQAATVPPVVATCSYSVSALSLAFPSSGGSAQVQVITTADCAWSSKSNTGWLKVSGSGTGGGAATLQLGRAAGGSRTATAVVAGHTVTVTQTEAPKK